MIWHDLTLGECSQGSEPWSETTKYYLLLQCRLNSAKRSEFVALFSQFHTILNLKLRRDRYYNLQNIPRIQIERSEDIIKKIFHHHLFVDFLNDVNSVQNTVNVGRYRYRPTFVYFSQATNTNYLNALMFHFSSEKYFTITQHKVIKGLLSSFVW